MKCSDFSSTTKIKINILKSFFTYSVLILLFASCGKERLDLSWNELSIDVSDDLEKVVFTSADTGYIVGGTRYERGLLLRTFDGAVTWQIDSLNRFSFYDIDVFNNNSRIYILGHYGHLIQTFNGGQSWNNRGLETEEAYWNMDFLSSDRGIAVGGGAFTSGGIHLFNVNQEGRDTFLKEPLHEMNDAAMIDEKVIVAVGFGIVRRSEDGGLTFQTMDIKGDNFVAVDFPTTEIGYMVSASGGIFKTIDAGITWQELNAPNNFTQGKVQFSEVLFLDEDKGYCIGFNGTFWKTVNGGDDWIIVKNLPSDADFTSIFIENGKGYLTALNGRFFEFVD